MDDDGLLLNISENTSEGVRQGKQKKGGRWTDRLKAKRTVKRKSQTVEEDGNVRKENSSGTGNILPPPHKKQRRDTQVDVNPVVSNSQSKSHPKQIVSSLFTSNPSVDTVKDIRHTQTPSKPSNAPLQDKSTFIGLGVDPLITTHLSSKMQILTPTTIQKEALPVLFMDPSDSSSTRDVFIQSQTGSGKTLSYLLPVIQDLLPLSSLSYIDRSIGTLAIIIAPTRELAKQISDVLEALLTMRLRASGETADDENSPHLTRWLVSGLLIGGATRTHEKARLRKGLPILVSTPGRLLDHLQNTSSFNVGKCRWLILDEADRLMELGFEDTLKQILQALDGRRKLALQAVEEGRSIEVSGWDWSRRRRTILCSATMKEDVQSLAGMVLVQPIIVKERPSDASSADSVSKAHAGGISQQNVAQEKFTPPSQLSQKYITVPLKLRLVTLIALLRSLLSLSRSSRGTKIIVFFSCTDSVDFHWMLFGNSLKEVKSEGAEEEQEDQSGEDTETNVIRRDSSFLPGASIYRLHGSLPLATRLTSLKEFSSVKPSSAPSASILFCTSVASRGLDLPLVRAVIQYDLPTEGGVNEYIHRVGRTARAGKGGEAWSFVSPSEKVWIDWINERLGKDKTSDQNISIRGENYATVLQSGFGGEGKQFEERATEIQMTLERWTSQNPRNIGLARKAFQSHVRAYATHPAEEKHIFHVRHLHLGHLAKAFALRDTPKDIASRNQKSSQKSSRRVKGGRTTDTETRPDLLDRSTKAESRMREIVRSQGKLNKKDGLMVTSGVSDFQVASVAELEKLVKQH